MFEAEAEAKASRPRPKFWPRGYFGLEDLTSLLTTEAYHCAVLHGTDISIKFHLISV